jgi:hypothetical protein
LTAVIFTIINVLRIGYLSHWGTLIPPLQNTAYSDEILGIAEISKHDIQPSLPTLTGIRADFLKGITGDGIVVLDDEKLLSDDKMSINL